MLSRDIFASKIRYCIIKLKEFSIEESEYRTLIKKSIDLFIETEFRSSRPRTRELDVDQALVYELSNCFQAWYRPDDMFLIDFAQDHQLIIAVNQEKRWRKSNLGDYFLQLPYFEAIAFLSALEISLTHDFHQNKFISKTLLTNLLSENIDKKYRPYSLFLLGIVSNREYGSKQEVTDFGRRVLLYVNTNLERFRDVILFLLESEASGFRYPDEVDLNEISKVIDSSSVLVGDQKKSIKQSLSLYRAGDFLDSIRILYPVLEGTLDIGLKYLHLKPSEFLGMRAKVEKLEKEGLISSKMSTGLEIFNGRNKLLHGNILEDDIETIRPLFSLVLAYLKRLITELDSSIKRPLSAG
jgi:hypothetical protein